MEDAFAKFNRRLNYLLTQTDEVYHEIAVHFGLSDSVMLILYALSDVGGACPLLALYRNTGLNKQTVNSALRKLEADGYVLLRPADRKSKLVLLTKDGQALASRTAQRVLRAENEIFAAWREADLQTYLRLTQRYLDELREKKKELENEPL